MPKAVGDSDSARPRRCSNARAAARWRPCSCSDTTRWRPRAPRLLETLRGLDVVLLADSHRSELERVAQVVFATRVVAEKHGTLTNHAGRVQRVVPAVEPSFDAHAEGEIMWRLGRALGLPGFDGAWDLQAVSKALAETVPAFAGIDLASVPPDGVPRADR